LKPSLDLFSFQDPEEEGHGANDERKEGETLQAKIGEELRKIFADVEAAPIPRRLAGLNPSPDGATAASGASAPTRSYRIFRAECFRQGTSCET
jgi:hypothetical protein